MRPAYSPNIFSWPETMFLHQFRPLVCVHRCERLRRTRLQPQCCLINLFTLFLVRAHENPTSPTCSHTNQRRRAVMQPSRNSPRTRENAAGTVQEGRCQKHCRKNNLAKHNTAERTPPANSLGDMSEVKTKQKADSTVVAREALHHITDDLAAEVALGTFEVFSERGQRELRSQPRTGTTFILSTTWPCNNSCTHASIQYIAYRSHPNVCTLTVTSCGNCGQCKKGVVFQCVVC